MKKQITIGVSESALEILNKIGKHTPAAGEAVENFAELYNRTLFDLRGKFDKNELTAIISNEYGTIQEPRTTGKQFLLIHLIDGNKYDNLFELNGCDSDILYKVSNLTDLEAFILHFWAASFWKKKNNLEEYISQLL